MSDAKYIYWCTQHKLETRPTFLCYMYDVKEGIDAKHTPADQMKCETCTFCCRKEKEEWINEKIFTGVADTGV